MLYTIINTANKTYTITISGSSIKTVSLNTTVTNYNGVGGTVVLTGYWYHHQVDSVMVVTELICDKVDDKYRFGFNGKEKDNEWAGIGNHMDFGERSYDSRVGRFISIDPMTKKYANYSPYLFAGNKPTVMIDVKGEEERYYKVDLIIDKKGVIHVAHFEEDKDRYKPDHWQWPITQSPSGLWGVRFPYVSTPDKYTYEVNVYQKKENVKQLNASFTVVYTPKEPDNRTKDAGKGGGWMLYGGNGGEDNRFNPTGHGGTMIDVSKIMAAFSVTGAASGASSPDKIGNALQYLINAGSAGSDAQNAAPIGITDEFRRDAKESKDESKEKECPGCGKKKDSTHIDNVSGEGTYKSIDNSNPKK